MMTRELENIFLERIASGLKRKSLTICSKWTENRRMMGKPFPGPWSFKYHPWLREMHDSTAQFNVGKKSAQMGYTETVLNRTFFKIDVERVDCLYVLPAKNPDASDFSAARFDPALEMSPHLARMFSVVKNIGHKRAGTTNLYIRGSKSKSGLKSVPVGFLVLDEVDEMEQDNIPLALERQSGQMEKEAWAISTPTIGNYGISALFNTTTKEHFFFKCPSCSRLTELTYPDCLEITTDDPNDMEGLKNSFLKCKECTRQLNHQTKFEWLSTGRWIPEITNREARGFYINQLYSSTVTPQDIARSALKARTNPADEQELYNSKLGLEHAVEGAKLTDAIIEARIGQHRRGPSRSNRLITMGVDVGKWLHVTIDEWWVPGSIQSDLNTESKCRTINITKVQHFEELDELMREYYVLFCVIDAHPERRKAYEFATRFWGHVKMCIYSRGITGKQISLGKEDSAEPIINVDRTSWIDAALARFKSGQISLPIDTPFEYKQHLKAPVRIYEKDADDNPVGRYVKGDEDDHYAHARTYSEIALPFAVSFDQCSDITTPVM